MLKRRILIGGVALTAAALGVFFSRRRDTPVEPVDPAIAALWGLEFELPQGGKMGLANLRGKPLILNFWATWCPPCVEELPLLERFYLQNSTKRFQMLGIAVDNAKAVNRFLEKMPLSFPTPLAGLAGIELSKSLGNLSGGLPFTIVLNAAGEVAVRHIGKLSESQIAAFSSIR